MSTETFYDQSLLETLSAQVLESREENGTFWLRLDRTLFYAEGGGMLADKGTISGHVLLGLKKEQDEIWHQLDQNLSGTVELKLDLADRLQRMQAHSTQHLVSALFIDEYHIDTISHHYLKNGMCDLDLAADSLSAEQMDHVEQLANEAITKDLPYQITYLSREQARQYTADFEEYQDLDRFRLVTIPGLDENLCGCPHVPSTRYLKGINLVRCERIGDHVRVLISCGDELIRQAHHQYDELAKASALLSAPMDQIPEGVQSLKDNLKQAVNTAGGWRQMYLSFYADSCLAQLGEEPVHILYEHRQDLEMKDLQFLVSRYTSHPAIVVIAVLSRADGTMNLMIARSKDLNAFSASAAFQKIKEAHGIRGGGSPAIAQGGGRVWETMEADLKHAVQEQLNK